MNVLPPGWEPPGALPSGVTVAPAADPLAAARVIAERIGGEVVVDVSAAERALAREASRRRAERTLEEAAEATRLVALLDGSDADADRELLTHVDDLRVTVEAGRLPIDVEEVARRAAELAGARAARKRLLSGDGDARGGDARDGGREMSAIDADAIRVAAAHLRAARVAADAAQRAVPRRPSQVNAEIELLRARMFAADAATIAAVVADTESPSGSRAAGVLAVATGAALLLLGATSLPVPVAGVLPVTAVTGLGVTSRRRRVASRRARLELESCRASAARAEATAVAVANAVDEWRVAVEAAAAAQAELVLATSRWRDVAGDDADVDDADELCEQLVRRRAVDEAVERLTAATAAWRDVVERAGFDPAASPDAVAAELRRRVVGAERARARLADVDAAREREDARARLHALLHGRRVERLQAEAEQARHLVAGAAPRALVLCEPFAQLGPGRRRALLRDLERSVQGVAVAVVTADEEALAWAEAHRQA